LRSDQKPEHGSRKKGIQKGKTGGGKKSRPIVERDLRKRTKARLPSEPIKTDGWRVTRKKGEQRGLKRMWYATGETKPKHMSCRSWVGA